MKALKRKTPHSGRRGSNQNKMIAELFFHSVSQVVVFFCCVVAFPQFILCFSSLHTVSLHLVSVWCLNLCLSCYVMPFFFLFFHFVAVQCLHCCVVPFPVSLFGCCVVCVFVGSLCCFLHFHFCAVPCTFLSICRCVAVVSFLHLLISSLCLSCAFVSVTAFPVPLFLVVFSFLRRGQGDRSGNQSCGRPILQGSAQDLAPELRSDAFAQKLWVAACRVWLESRTGLISENSSRKMSGGPGTTPQ